MPRPFRTALYSFS
jgi:cytochrome c